MEVTRCTSPALGSRCPSRKPFHLIPGRASCLCRHPPTYLPTYLTTYLAECFPPDVTRPVALSPLPLPFTLHHASRTAVRLLAPVGRRRAAPARVLPAAPGPRPPRRGGGALTLPPARPVAVRSLQKGAGGRRLRRPSCRTRLSSPPPQVGDVSSCRWRRMIICTFHHVVICVPLSGT